jgi:carbon storage regulator CsrA
MLVLSRKAGERIRIGNNITIVVNRVVGSRVSVGIEAPSDVRIVRGELEFFDEEPAPVAKAVSPACAMPSVVPAMAVARHH